MIHHIRGIVTHIKANKIVVETNGVGYELTTPTPQKWSEFLREETTILTRQITNDNGTELFAFADDEIRDLFDLLTKHVSGVGPKTALNILANIPAGVFKEAVGDGDTARLTAVKGIGKKNAERIVVELRDKVGIAGVWKARASSTDPALEDTILALIALGHTKTSAEKTATAVRKQFPDANAEMLTREALRA